MKIAKRDDFGLLFMSSLAKVYPGKYLPLSRVAGNTNLSPLFLKHIASSLVSKGLIVSKEGVDGGYRLSKSPEKISVADILKAVSGDIIIPACADGVCRVKKKNCQCIPLWGKVNERLFGYLNKLTLSEFINL